MTEKEEKYKADSVGFYRTVRGGDIARPIAFADHGWAIAVDTPTLAFQRENNRTRLETVVYKFDPRGENNGNGAIYNALKKTAQPRNRWSNTIKRR